MKTSDALELVKLLAQAFPRDRFPAESQIVFAKGIGDLALEPTTAGVSDLIATLERLPSIAAIRAASRERSGDVDAGIWSDGWTELLDAIRKHGAGDMPHWSSPRLAATVRAIGYRFVCHCSFREIPTIRAQFRDIWNDKAGAARDATNRHLGELEPSSEGAKLVGQVADALRLKP